MSPRESSEDATALLEVAVREAAAAAAREARAAALSEAEAAQAAAVAAAVAQAVAEVREQSVRQHEAAMAECTQLDREWQNRTRGRAG